MKNLSYRKDAENAMSHRKYRIPFKASCWNCRRLKKSKREMDVSDDGGAVSISAPSIMDALAGYYCDKYWFGDKPDKDELLCGGREYQSVYN